MANEQRFLDKADVYERYRPSYPVEMIDYLCRYFKNNNSSLEHITIADIGAGTGLFTRLLLQRGFRVIAIEPNKDMLSKLILLLEQYPNTLTIQKGSAENTALARSSVDMIVCAQAFHWVDEVQAKVEWRHILKQDGHAALIWNQRVIDENDFMRSYERLFLDMAVSKGEPSFKHVSHKYVSREALESFYGSLPKVYKLPYEQQLNEAAFIGRVKSSSYAPREDDPRYFAFIEEAKRIYRCYKDEQKDSVTMMYETVCYIQRFT